MVVSCLDMTVSCLEIIVSCLDTKVFSAIVVPQKVDMGNLITVTVDGTDYNLKKAFTFTAGKRHTFTITLAKTGSGIDVSIGAWNVDDTDNGGTATGE